MFLESCFVPSPLLPSADTWVVVGRLISLRHGSKSERPQQAPSGTPTCPPARMAVGGVSTAHPGQAPRWAVLSFLVCSRTSLQQVSPGPRTISVSVSALVFPSAVKHAFFLGNGLSWCHVHFWEPAPLSLFLYHRTSQITVSSAGCNSISSLFSLF